MGRKSFRGQEIRIPEISGGSANSTVPLLIDQAWSATLPETIDEAVSKRA
jgi:hypothetical protein